MNGFPMFDRVAAVVSMLILGGTAGLTAEALIRFEKQVLETKFYAEGAAIGDVNGDGNMDVVYGPFWYEGPDFHKRHEFYRAKEFSIDGYSDNFFAFVEDVDGDGAKDILVLGFPGKEARLYLNPGNTRLAEVREWPVHLIADVVDNESPDFVDIDGDGVKEIVCSREGRFGFYRPASKDVTKPWKWLAVTEDVGVQKFTHGLGVGDVDGDGRLDLLETKRWWQAPAAKEGSWVARPFQPMGSGGAQMFAYDFNADGRNDIITSLNAHQFGIAWFENKMGLKGWTGANWVQHLMVGKEPWENEYGVRFSQPHALALADVNGDGVMDLITGKRFWAHNGKDPNERDAKVIYWFETRRGKDGQVQFVPHLMDDDTGVGTQVVSGDVNGDGWVDVVVGNKAGLRVLVQKREEVDAIRYAQFQPKKIYGPQSIKTGDYQKGQKVEEAVKSMVLPAGFKAEVVASEPEVVQPIAFCWDAKGRIWLLEGNTYPTRAAEGEGKDRIVIFEDTDGNGSFETRKVFMEGLNLASGIEVGFGGVWVGAAPHLMFIADRNGDDRPDGAPEILLDGWGYHDTHETLNSFIWGPDGWLYGCHGVFTHSKVGKPGTPEKERVPLNAAVWRFHPTRHQFEVVAHGTSNPWGLDFNEKAEFFTTACVIPHLYHIVPGGRYQRQAGQHFNEFTYDDIKTIADFRHYAGDIRNNAHWGNRQGKFHQNVPNDTDQAGGGHAHCGLAIYQGENFPKLYQGALLFGNLHGHRLVHNAVERSASGYRGERRADFLRSNDFWFIPVTQKVGPDGALYVSDWSDKQVCHQVNPLVWDRSNGRLYRIFYDQLKPWKGDLNQLNPAALLERAVMNTNEWEVRMARRLLVEKAAAGEWSLQKEGKVLEQWLQTETQLTEAERLRAFLLKVSVLGLKQTAAGSGWLSGLDEQDEQIRAWSVRAYGDQTHDGFSDLGKIVIKARHERSAWVRREMASLLQRLPIDLRGELAFSLMSHQTDEGDPMIPLLVWYGIEPLVGLRPEAGLELAAECQWQKLKGFIYRRMASSDETRAALLQGLVRMDDVAQREAMLELILNIGRGGAALNAPEGWAEMLNQLREDATPKMLELVNELAAYFGDAEALKNYRLILADATVPIERRELALSILTKMRDDSSTSLLHAIVEEGGDLRRQVIQSLGFLGNDQTGQVLTKHYSQFSADEKMDAVTTLASSVSGAVALLEAVEHGIIATTTLSPYLLRQLQALNHEQVHAKLALAVGTMNQAKPGVKESIAKWRSRLSSEKLKAADLKLGKQIYLESCGTCHVLNGEGSHVGPDLTGSNRGNLEYLLENVLDPNALIGRDYQLNVFTMKDGRVLSGIVKGESVEGYQLVLPGGAVFGVNKEEVKNREVSKMSTMPEGLFDALGEEKTVHLVAYLQHGTGGSNGSDGFSPEGLMEAETLESISASGGVARSQPMGSFKGGRWSGDSQLWWTGGNTGDLLTLEFMVENDGRYEIKGALTRALDYAIVEININGKTVGDPLDLYDPRVTSTGELHWGTHDLKKGAQRIEIKIIGSNSQAKPSKMVGVDYLRVTKMVEKVTK